MLGVLMLASTPLLAGEFRYFVSTAGTLLEAELTAVNGPNASLRKKDDGGLLVVPRATLCKEDQNYIEFWAAAHPEAASQAPAAMATATAATSGPKFSLFSTIRSTKSSRGAADGGLRTIDIGYNIQLQSREVRRELNGAKAIIITLGRDASSGMDDRLYVMQKLEWDLNLRAQAKFEQTTPEVRLSYYQDASERRGAREYGYLFVVVDAAGVIQHVDSSPDGMKKFAQKVLELSAPAVVDRELKVLPDAAFHQDILLNR